MPEKEPSFDPDAPVQEQVSQITGQKPEKESKAEIGFHFLQKQFNLPREQWDEQFQALVQEKSEANQRAIQETEQAIERGEHEMSTQTPTESPEVISQQTFERYKKGLGLNEENLKGKRILDLGSGQGDFVEQLIQEGITQEAYGLDANPENFPAEKRAKDYLFQGDFQKELPVKNLDYVVSLGAVSSSFFVGNEDVDIDSIIKNSLDALNEEGEIRIYPIQEAAKDSELIGLKESHRKWVELVNRIAEDEGVQCTMEPRDVKVVGRNNDVILESVLIVKKLSEKGRKEKKWQRFEERFKTETDGLGYGIEKGIMDTVVGLNAVALNTNQSCEGHVDRGRITPWIDIEAPNRPNQYINEDKIYQEVACEQKIPVEDIFIGAVATEAGKIAWHEVQKRLEYEEENPEYSAWNQKNKELWQKAKKLVMDFRKKTGIHLTVTKRWANGFTIYTGRNDYGINEKQRSEKQKAALEKRLVKYREEFKQFAEFLKNKFLS